MNRRHAWLAAGLLATLVATWWAAGLDADAGDDASTRHAARPDAKHPRRATKTPAPAFAPVSLSIERRPLAGEGADLFAVTSFAPPPPPSPPPPPPPKPTAPPLPFRYLGSLSEGDEAAVYLGEGSRIHVLKAGDKIDTRYRVDAIDASRVALTYLPLDQHQELLIGRP